jgi:hypothetical protein
MVVVYMITWYEELYFLLYDDTCEGIEGATILHREYTDNT